MYNQFPKAFQKIHPFPQVLVTLIQEYLLPIDRDTELQILINNKNHDPQEYFV